MGFSIGFERIFGILSESGFAIPDEKRKIALFCDESSAVEASRRAEELRAEYIVSVLERPKKIGKMLARLEERGYAGYLVLGEGEEIKFFQK